MSEASKQAYILKELRKLQGSFWIKPTITNYAGCPDILGAYNGAFVAFEVKDKATDKATKLQEYRMIEISRAGGVACVVRSLKDCIKALGIIEREVQ